MLVMEHIHLLIIETELLEQTDQQVRHIHHLEMELIIVLGHVIVVSFNLETLVEHKFVLQVKMEIVQYQMAMV